MPSPLFPLPSAMRFLSANTTRLLGLSLLATLCAPSGPQIFEPRTPLPTGPFGSVLETAPPLDWGALPAEPNPTLAGLREHLVAGDQDRALSMAEGLANASKYRRSSILGAYVAGHIYRSRQLHNLASARFTRVRARGGSLALWAAYYEAEQDFLRGKPQTAIRECKSLRKTWPESRFDSACRRLMTRAYVAAGAHKTALQEAKSHDEDHPNDPILEQVELAIAMRLTTSHPDEARKRLEALAVSHRAPLTGRRAEELLKTLDPDWRPPSDIASMQARAVSLRDGARLDEAWSLFEQLRERAESEDDQTLQTWLLETEDRFAWRTHHWSALRDQAKRRFDAEGSEKDLWTLYKALDRQGDPIQALATAKQGLKQFGNTKTWRRTEEIVARTALLAKDYAEARTLFDTAKKRGGWSGRRAAFFAGFSAYKHGDHEDAIRRFTAIINSERGHINGSRYWRSRAYQAGQQDDLARADENWLSENAPFDWYTMQVTNRRAESTESESLTTRDGRWPHPSETPFEVLTLEPAPTIANSWSLAQPANLSSTRRLASLSWPLSAPDPLPTPPPSAVSEAFANVALPPSSYRDSELWDRKEAEEHLRAIAAAVGDDWPEWQAVLDMADAGLYDHSGPLLAELIETWKEARRKRNHPLHRVAKTIPKDQVMLRFISYYARNHHHTDRYSYGMWKSIEDERLRQEMLRLGWPLAHDHVVWENAKKAGLDPYLVMALMRVESRYNSTAVSRVGARGAMQIMPRTGRLIADLKDEQDFMTGDLEDPLFAVGYGIFYLGKLRDRFDGNTALAVASYNGGPFNVGAWLKNTSDLPMDEFVEHIPFRETRRYVRSVMSGYNTYLTVYEGQDTRAVLFEPPYQDDPSVIDF